MVPRIFVEGRALVLQLGKGLMSSKRSYVYCLCTDVSGLLHRDIYESEP